MAEPKFTPGPWRVEENTTLIWGACNADDTSTFGMGYPIAECHRVPTSYWAKGPSLDEGLANARLIAAAPEMYEVLRECLPLFDMVSALDDHGSNALGQAENLIRAALAKAEGRSDG